jgi:hypothetical protein
MSAATEDETKLVVFDSDKPRFTCSRLNTVKFSNDVRHIPILYEDMWYKDYFEARCGWIYELDRSRFTMQISDVNTKIGWIFDIAHRDRVYKSRF